MATPLLQRPSVRRKIVYLVLILVLFVVTTFVWRGVPERWSGGELPAYYAAVPQSDAERQAGIEYVLPKWSVTAQANALELREVNQGEAELTGSALRLLLTGSRGVATTLLWRAAIEKQLKNEWNELEVIVKSLTKLQPHFLTPWLFQSWNLAYNVSVESDRVKDKFFYISRGIELLAQGERLNRNNPDMRFWIGFYYQNKFGVSDEANTLRSLFQMSLIDPNKRNPKALRPDGKTVDIEQFATFCAENPQLVRRLRDALRYSTPADVVDFLADNRKVPTRYVDPEQDAGLLFGPKSGLKPGPDQFPALPGVPSRFGPNEPTWNSNLGDDFDNFQAARAWYSYAQDPLPEPEKIASLKTREERMREPKNKGKRIPRQPAEVIFRQYPARSQSYIAERLEKEGWFDESGWTVDAGRSRSDEKRWFPDRDVVLGTGRSWAADAWSSAFLLWRAHGERTGMYLDPTELIRLNERARLYRDTYNVQSFEMGRELREDALSPEMRASYLAHRQVFFYGQDRQMTNFPRHYFQAMAEKDPVTVKARKLLYEAERLRKAAEPGPAMQLYQEAFAVWKKQFEQYKDFHSDPLIQEDVYEAQLHYLDLVQEHRGEQLRPALMVEDLLAELSAGPGGGSLPAQVAAGFMHGFVNNARALPLPIVGPLDGTDAQGVAWISPETKSEVRRRLGYEVESPPPEAASQPNAAPAGAQAVPRAGEAMSDAVLALLAHPDDAEFLCAGTLARLVREHGWRVHVASMTPGDCGSAEHTSEEISRIRRGEGAASAALLGGAYHCLEERDLSVFYSERTLAKAVRLLREVRPRLVLLHSPTDYMLDHEQSSVIGRAAAFAAPIPLFLKAQEGPPPLDHIPHVYYCDPIEGKDPLGRPVPPDLAVDVSGVIDLKERMLACHASQREWLRKHHGMDQYLMAMREWGGTRGREYGVAFAEGFRQHRGHSYPPTDLLGDLLGRLSRV